MTLESKLLLTKYELSFYLTEDKLPVYIVTEAGVIKSKIEHVKNTTVRITNYLTDLEELIKLETLYTTEKYINFKDKIYTFKGISSYLDKTDVVKKLT